MNDEKLEAGLASDLNRELGLLKDIINRVADELGLPTENGNRVHDLQFWLDSPKIEVDNETLKKAAANMVVGIPESDEEFRFRKAEIISEVIDAVAGLLGWRKT